MSKGLLICTQIMDENDPVLGFFHSWVEAISQSGRPITVICLKKGTVNLPGNVEVFSLGKEQGASKFSYVIRFFRYIFRERRKYASVLVHMNSEYVVLGGIFWRMLGKRVVLWYNHTTGNFKTHVAMILANVVCHTSPYAFTAGKRKSRRMPAGIDTSLFSADNTADPGTILYLGRIAPVKGVKEIVEAAIILDSKEVDFKLSIFGDALPKDYSYRANVQEVAEDLSRKGKVVFHSSVTKQEAAEIFSKNEVFINLTPRGNYDKTVLEAALSGSIPVVSSLAFSDLLDNRLFSRENDPSSLAQTIEQVLSLPKIEKESIIKELKRKVAERHSLLRWKEEITTVLFPYEKNQ